MFYPHKILNDKKEKSNSKQSKIAKSKKNNALGYEFYRASDSIIISKEIESWKNFSYCLRKKNIELFEQMLQSCYQYSSSINIRCRKHSTESLFMTILFEQYKQLLLKS
jgi:hypothetical protein